jgi:type II secretory ATPase GspE/PulE/Tfp pilus assembly ATPase PilB-like protein
MNSLEQDIYNVLVQRGLLNDENFTAETEDLKRLKISFFEYLLSKKYIDEKTLLNIISEIKNIPFVNLREVNIEKSVIDLVPARIAWHYKFLPIKIEFNTMTIAVSEPISIGTHDELKLMLGYKISTVLAKREQINDLLKVHYGLAADIVGHMLEHEPKSTVDKTIPLNDNIENVEKMAGEASIIKLVNQIIFEAYKKRATDIHIEPFRGKLRLRYRIDGILRDQNVPEEVHSFFLPILSRIKIMSNLNIVEHRVPQDGRATVKTHNEILDLRVSFIPTPHGESVVIRMLPTKMFFNIQQLGLSEEYISIFRSLINRNNGIILITGPTGSGKSTTLYSCLKEVNSSEKKIVTIEDPIEYEMQNIIQVNVNSATGLTFAAGLRSMLRHDPDIIMVGEIRDKETAEIAIRVALTGHLVFSTLHTNDSATGALRLIDIGIEPYLVASSIVAFIAQRLVRIICPKCKYESEENLSELKQDIARDLNFDSTKEIKIFKGKGCEHCNFTGYFGRTAIYEILMVNQDIKTLISERASSSEIKQKAVELGMKTLLKDGWQKVVDGITTPEEVLQICQDTESNADGAALKSKISNSEIGSKQYGAEDRRLYTRIPTMVPLWCRVVEKGDGDILKLDHSKPFLLNQENAFGEKPIFADINKVVSKEKVSIEAFAVTANVSAGGALIESEYLFPKDSILELKIYLSAFSPIVCHGKVVRTGEGLPFCFYIAVCFLDVSGEQRRLLDDFVKSEQERQNILTKG